MSRRLRLAISSCLLGHEVRWNGQHRRDAYCADVLGRAFELVPVCPELELGLGVPREPIHLRAAPRGLRLVGNQSGRDHTRAMHRFSAKRLAELAALDLAGACLKKDSPSCGPDRVAVARAAGRSARDGTGLFAAAFRRAFPLVPIVDEEGLADDARRASFLARVVCHDRLRTVGRASSRDALAAFHARHAVLLGPSDAPPARALARLVERGAPRSLHARYTRAFLRALEVPPAAAVLAQVLGLDPRVVRG